MDRICGPAGPATRAEVMDACQTDISGGKNRSCAARPSQPGEERQGGGWRFVEFTACPSATSRKNFFCEHQIGYAAQDFCNGSWRRLMASRL